LDNPGEKTEVPAKDFYVTYNNTCPEVSHVSMLSFDSLQLVPISEVRMHLMHQT
jgi:hypothetical protein